MYWLWNCVLQKKLFDYISFFSYLTRCIGNVLYNAFSLFFSFTCV